jgi:sigma-B regulation protein RsbU (phosphoserine phosphatase)
LNNDVVLLAQVPLFTKLSLDELRHLASNLKTCQYSPGEIIFNEGDKGDHFYIVHEGQLEILKSLGSEDERVLALRNPGEFVGEMSLFRKDGLRMATARAASQTSLWVMSRQEFNDLLHRQPLLAYEMVNVLSARLTNAHNAAIKDLREKNRQLRQAYEELKAAQEQIIEKEKLEHELTLAHDIQMSILPQTLPRLPGFDFGARIETARSVGGDFYDFIPLGKDKLGLTIGDVTDKGVPAALFMTQTQALLRAEARRGGSPRQTLINVNEHLMEKNANGLFVTVLYGIMDRKKRLFSYARAGHELPIICKSSHGAELMPLHPGQPLGILDEPRLDEQTVQFSPGDLLLLYTDGLTDECNPQGASFGMERLLPLACEVSGMGAQQACDHIFRRVTKFLGGAAQYDDLTMIVIGGT